VKTDNGPGNAHPELAKLELTLQEKELYCEQLSAILEYADSAHPALHFVRSAHYIRSRAAQTSCARTR